MATGEGARGAAALLWRRSAGVRRFRRSGGYLGWGLAVELYCGMGNPRVCSDKRIWGSGHGCGGAGGEPRRGAARRVQVVAYRL